MRRKTYKAAEFIPELLAAPEPLNCSASAPAIHTKCGAYTNSLAGGTALALVNPMENETEELNRMEQKLDIFLRLPDGKPLWVESVAGYEKAKLRLEELIQTTPGDYFLFNAKTGEIVRD